MGGFQRLSVVGFIGILVLLGLPRGALRPRHEPPAGACDTGTVACCCGVAGGCGTCPTEQKTAAQREAALLILRAAGCPEPVREAATPGGSPKFIVPGFKPFRVAPLAAQWLARRSVSPPASPLLAPEPPPPRFIFRTIP